MLYTVDRFVTKSISVIDCFCVSIVLHMTEQLKIISYILQHTNLNPEISDGKETIHKSIYETAQIIRMNDLLEEIMSMPIFIRYTCDTLALCCIVYITPLVSIIFRYKDER